MSSTGSRKLRSGVVAAVVAALAVVLSPLPATAAPTKPPKPPALSTKGLDKHGDSSETGEALAKAKRTNKAVEVVDQRQASSTTFANPDGTLSVSLSQRPTRVKKAGEWVPIDTTLVKSSKGRFAPKATTSKVTLRATASSTSSTKTVAPAKPGVQALAPADADPGVTADVVSLDPPGAADISMGFGADLPAPTVAGDVATYALGGGAVLTASAMNDGFTADVILATAPTAEPTYKFPLDLAGGLTPSLKDHTLQFTDASGQLMAISRPLQMWDAQRDAGGDPSNVMNLDATLVQTAGGWELDLTAPMAFLAAPTTQYPVRVDPTVTLAKKDEGNTYYYNGNTVDHTASYYLAVGKKNDSGDDSVADRTYINFNTGQFIGKTVTRATLRMYQYLAGSCSAKSVKIYPTTTKSAIDSSLVHTNEDSAWSVDQSFNTGANNCTPAQSNGYQDIDVTKIVTGWETGEIVDQFGMEIQAGSETDTAYYKRFCSETLATSGTGRCETEGTVPLLVITYVPELGTQGSYEMFTHKLNDRSQLSVNTRYGNAVVRASDIHVSGQNRDLSVDRFYNAQPSPAAGAPAGQFGRGWTLSGADVGLLQVTPGNNDRFYYIAPGGTYYGPFVRKTSSGDTDGFFEPKYGGSDVSLTDKRDGTYVMKFHKSQEKYTFTTNGCTSCTFLPMKYDTDRYKDVNEYQYDTTAPYRLNAIIDTEKRIFNVHRNTGGLIDSISEAPASWTPSPRTWSFGYTGSQLTSYTDPTGAVTNYTYTGTAATDTLQAIADPVQKDGDRPTTKLTYAAGQVTAVDYYLNAGGTSAKRFTFSYAGETADDVANCHTDSNDTWTALGMVSDVSDPQYNGQPTKYCYKDRTANLNYTKNPDDSEGKQRAIDPLGHRRTISFTPNNDVSTGTGQAQTGETNGITAYRYDANNNLTQAIRPKDKDVNGEVAGTTSFDYNISNKSSVAGGEFLPSSATTTGSSCTSMGYDSSGGLTDTYTGQAATNSGTSSNCTGKTSGAHSHVDYYNNDGTDAALWGLPKRAYSAVVGKLADADRQNSDWTNYTYFTAAPNIGKLARIVRPEGNGGQGGDGLTTCGTDRTGCTTYTYDGRSRVATLTDGNGKTTTYTYDNDDRVTQVLTNGATTCTPTAGTCVRYTWDGEGNPDTRVDVKGTTSFTYDWLNHQASQAQPDGTVISTTYDAAGNLTQYKQTIPGQTVDTVNYTYDAANELKTIADATGSYTYTYDEDARPTNMTMPSASGVSVAYDYFHTGKTKSIDPTGVTGLPSQYLYDYGDTVNGIETDSDKLHKITYGTTDSDPHVSYTYNTDDRLQDVSPSQSSLGSSYHYTYNDNADIAGVDTTTNGNTTYKHYGYNYDDQLCWAGPTDNTGSSVTRNCSAPPNGNTAYTSDKQGNNLGTTTGPLHYNAQNQADQLTSPAGGSATTMTYFDQGNNLRATAGGDTFTGGSQLGVTSRRNTGGVTYYTRDPYGQLINTHGAGGTYYYLLDRQGSVLALIATNGGLAGTYKYDPYGKTTPVSGTSTTAAQNNPWRYTGAYQDPADTYYKLGARYYDAAGHFTQADNIAGSLDRPEKYNSYSYTAGDPINNTDPSGNYSWSQFAVDAGGAAGTRIGQGIAAAACVALAPTGVGIPLCVGAVVLSGAILGCYGAAAASNAVGQSQKEQNDACFSAGVGALLGGK